MQLSRIAPWIRRCLLMVGVAVVGLWGSTDVAAQSPPHVTFTKDIAPILQRSCQKCHNPEGGAPMALVTYADTRPYARSMKRKTTNRQMPPFFIDPLIGEQRFEDDTRLSEDEIAKIAAWADGGAPQGDPADMPPPVKFPSYDDWTIGTPDLIVSSPTISMQPVQADLHVDMGPVPTGLTEDRYIKAVECKEVWLNKDGTRRKTDMLHVIVHHAEIYTGSMEELAKGPAGGPTGLGDGLFRIIHEVGQNAEVYGDKAGIMLKANGAMSWAPFHLHANGQETLARLDVAFKFYPKGYKPKYMQSGQEVLGLLHDELEIPPNDPNFRVDSFQRFKKPALMTTFEPHMHTSGKRMCMELIYPDDRREMVNCANYDHNWVRVYTYADGAQPLIPAGTMLHLIGWYDTSPSNREVSETRNWEVWGWRTIDQMFHLLPKVSWLTEEEYQTELAARQKQQAPAANQSVTRAR